MKAQLEACPSLLSHLLWKSRVELFKCKRIRELREQDRRSVNGLHLQSPTSPAASAAGISSPAISNKPALGGFDTSIFTSNIGSNIASAPVLTDVEISPVSKAFASSSSSRRQPSHPSITFSNDTNLAQPDFLDVDEAFVQFTHETDGSDPYESSLPYDRLAVASMCTNIIAKPLNAAPVSNSDGMLLIDPFLAGYQRPNDLPPSSSGCTTASDTLATHDPALPPATRSSADEIGPASLTDQAFSCPPADVPTDKPWGVEENLVTSEDLELLDLFDFDSFDAHSLVASAQYASVQASTVIDKPTIEPKGRPHSDSLPPTFQVALGEGINAACSLSKPPYDSAPTASISSAHADRPDEVDIGNGDDPDVFLE
ncbi:hypothetical protein P7C71_g1884, partial [Lecanoromycetidae sp. Uapishka_2]